MFFFASIDTFAMDCLQQTKLLKLYEKQGLDKRTIDWRNHSIWDVAQMRVKNENVVCFLIRWIPAKQNGFL